MRDEIWSRVQSALYCTGVYVCLDDLLSVVSSTVDRIRSISASSGVEEYEERVSQSHRVNIKSLSRAIAMVESSY